MRPLPLHVLTIALDAMPWIASIFTELNRVNDCDWTWHIVEGAAMNRNCTSWMNPQPPRLSKDGTSEFIESLKYHPRVRVYKKVRWDGKVEMVNAPLSSISSEAVLLQCDSDELHTATQLTKIVKLFENNDAIMGLRFKCRYFVGPSIITDGDDCYGNNSGEWMRAWRFLSGMKFDKHEPPILSGNRGHILTREETAALGLVFDHYAWATDKQCRMKQALYGRDYITASQGWRRLQSAVLPVKLNSFFPWVDSRVIAKATGAAVQTALSQ